MLFLFKMARFDHWSVWECENYHCFHRKQTAFHLGLRTNVLKYSFFHPIIGIWNQLPFDIRYSDNVNIVKSRVKKFIGDS